MQATPLLDRYLFNTFKKAFGGRVRFIVSGGAPLSTHVEEYLKVTLCTPVFQVCSYPQLFTLLMVSIEGGKGQVSGTCELLNADAQHGRTESKPLQSQETAA